MSCPAVRPLPAPRLPHAACLAMVAAITFNTAACSTPSSGKPAVDAVAEVGGADDTAADVTAPDAAVDAGVRDTGSAARASAGCTAPGTAYVVGSQTGQVTVGARPRSFVVHVPTGYTPGRALPTVVLLHGGLGTGAQLEGSALMSPIADREGFVAVYPDGISRSWNAGRCCGPPAEQNIDDVGFIAALLDHLQTQLCLDLRRVYATGMSNGAMMSHRLACELSERLTAVAPVAGTNMTDSCAPLRPVPVMHIHGADDKHVPWQGGAGCGIAGVPFTGVPESINGWLARNGCASAPPSLLLEQGDGRCESQGRCPASGDVVLCTIAGGGHSWPGGAAAQGQGLPACTAAGEGIQSRTFIASEQIWTFFKTQALP